MYGLGWALGGVYGTAVWCSVWCVVWLCVVCEHTKLWLAISPSKNSFRKKKTVLGAGPIRPNPLSFSKSIGAFLPQKLYTGATWNEVFSPFLRRISAKKKVGRVAVSSSTWYAQNRSWKKIGPLTLDQIKLYKIFQNLDGIAIFSPTKKKKKSAPIKRSAWNRAFLRYKVCH